MKRRNAETGKLRRPLKRTKITEGMYGNSMLYLKFVMVWASVVLADYMLEFRFEFLWPFWMILRSVYDSYKYQGLAFSVFFVCIALTSDMICYFFIPVQYIFFAASTYVWVQYVWYSFAEKGICVPTVAICCFIVYMEGVRGAGAGAGVGAGAGAGARVLAAHAVGFPAVTLGVGVKACVAARLRAHTQRAVHAHNAFYFQLMRDALPQSGVNVCAECGEEAPSCECNAAPPPRANGAPANGARMNGAPLNGARMNGAPANGARVNGAPPLRRRCRQENGHCTRDAATLHLKLDLIEQHLDRKNSKEKSDKSHNHVTSNNVSNSAVTAHANGVAHGADDDDRHVHSKGSAKSTKYDKKESTSCKEERRKHKNRDKDKEPSDKSTEQTKEEIIKDKDVDSTHINTTDAIKIKEINGITKDRERERDRDKEGKERERDAKEREREQREKEKENREKKEREAREKEKEKEREREREARSNRETTEELKRVRSELSAARSALTSARSELSSLRTELASVRTELNIAKQNEAEAKKQLAAEKQKKQEKHSHNKSCAWGRERGVLERRLADERRARHAAQLHQDTGSTSTSTSTSGSVNGDSSTTVLRRELARAREAQLQLQRELQTTQEQLRTAETAVNASDNNANGNAAGWAARAQQLERALSAETRVKLDLLAALGDANRRMHIQDSIINRQEKELEELKAQMLAVMPTEVAGPAPGAVSKLRLDPTAAAYTPAPPAAPAAD